MDLFLDLARLFVSLVALKALIVGSDFNFLKWFKYGKKYTDWYFINREDYDDV